MAPRNALLAIAAFCSALVVATAVAPGANCDLLYEGTPLSDPSWYSFLNVSIYEGPLKDDAAPGVVYFSLDTKEVTGFVLVTPSDYIDVQLDTTTHTLSLVVTEAFPRYEEDMISASQASTIDIEVQFRCSDGNTAAFVFRVTVEDVNNHVPVFEQSSYEYELPMPFPPGTNLSCIVGVINVEDIDLSNSLITVRLEEVGDQLLRAETIYQGSRSYAVQLFSKALIELEEGTSFSMTAVDSGTPARTSDPVTIVINKVNVNKYRRHGV